MESHQSPDDARALLSEIHADRVVLADRLVAPTWFYPTFAALTALYVGTPSLPDGHVRSVSTSVLVAAAIVTTVLYPRLTGVRPSGVGVVGWCVLGGLLVTVLGSLSVSYGLVASLSAWWVLVPQALCFVLVLFGGRLFDREYRRHLHADDVRRPSDRPHSGSRS
jgi:hypothetical protein